MREEIGQMLQSEILQGMSEFRTANFFMDTQ